MEYYTTIGIDVSDRTSKICVMTKDAGKRLVLETTTIPTTKEGLQTYLSQKDRKWPVVFETGTHCRWMKDVVESLGMRAIIANPAKVRLMAESNTKNDSNDAASLARIALADVELLHPVSLRSEKCHQMMRLLKARDSLVGTRTRFVNQLRGFAKSMGFRLPSCSANKAHLMDKSVWPSDFEEVAWPIIDLLEVLDVKIKAYESQIKRLGEDPELRAQIERVREVYGIGILFGSSLVAAIGAHPERFRKSRDAGAFFGLVPRQRQSGDVEEQCHITLAGCQFVRRLAIEAAQIAMRDSAKDTDIKLKGMRICTRGGGNISKRKALVAVARSLVVTAVALLKKPDAKYIPLSEAGEKGIAKIRAETSVAA